MQISVVHEYEASPWCRLIREYLTILGLTAEIRPCPRQTLFMEGAFTAASRFRPEALRHLQSVGRDENDLKFPVLVDESSPNKPVVLAESYDILGHLWENYSESVLQASDSPSLRRRPDQVMNNPKIPFPLRFLSLAGPSFQPVVC